MKKLFSVVAILSAAGCVYASDGGKIPNGFSFQGRIEANGSNENAERVDVFDLSEKEVSNLLSIIDNINS